MKHLLPGTDLDRTYYIFWAMPIVIILVCNGIWFAAFGEIIPTGPPFKIWLSYWVRVWHWAMGIVLGKRLFIYT